MPNHSFILYKLLINCIKYFPIIGALCMLIHCILLLIGIESSIFHFTFGFSIVGSLLLLLASYVLNFCALHRLFIIYDFIMEFCINYENYFGFGIYLLSARFLMALIGIILFILFFMNITKFKCDDIKNINSNIKKYCRSIRCRKL